MAWGRFKTFVREYLTFQAMNRLQDDVYSKLNFLNDNKVNNTMVTSNAQPNKLLKLNTNGVMDVSISGDAATAGNGVPAGFIGHFPTESIPINWLECDGSTKSRTEFPYLFAAIGTMYGEGDGISTFGIPDLRGEFIRAWSHGKLDAEGNPIDPDREVGTHQDDQFQKHQHTFLTDDIAAQFGYSQLNSVGIDMRSYNGGNAGTYRTNDDTVNSGGDETRPSNIALVACIYAGKGPVLSTTNPASNWSHSALLNLTATDDHTQYLALTGRNGIQTLNGSLDVTGNITINGIPVDNNAGEIAIGSSTDLTSAMAGTVINFTNTSPITVRLPAAANSAGKHFYFDHTGSANVTVEGHLNQIGADESETADFIDDLVGGVDVLSVTVTAGNYYKVTYNHWHDSKPLITNGVEYSRGVSMAGISYDDVSTEPSPAITINQNTKGYKRLRGVIGAADNETGVGSPQFSVKVGSTVILAQQVYAKGTVIDLDLTPWTGVNTLQITVKRNAQQTVYGVWGNLRLVSAFTPAPTFEYDLIEAATNLVVTPAQQIHLWCDGSQWYQGQYTPGAGDQLTVTDVNATWDVKLDENGNLVFAVR